MRRRVIMTKLEGRQYVSRFMHDNDGDMNKSRCYMSVRKRGVGPDAKETQLGVWKVKQLKPEAYEELKFIPGTYKRFRGASLPSYQGVPGQPRKEAD